ncbi:S8 family serine peptidase [Streptomyces genisteinicus]|uniref:S8 family serine peptidase n=1 Tax=Streptomyces genisteinicus TaxID=2768068 RepID=A0A7H0HZ31_9ACTN|nr:S8 family serine peptidase [Streptomyces genisteinicus]QNP65797.1 S8 family serine peptidase [Streptomyces genisteinicus]
MHLPRPPRRRHAAWAAAALTATALAAGALPAVAAATPSAEATPSALVAAKVDPSLRGAVAEGEAATFFVVLKDQADLSRARKQRTHAARAKAAFTELRAKAADTQAPLRSFLDRKKVGHQDFWIANALRVTGDQRLVDELAARPDVASVVREQHYSLDPVETAGAQVTASRAKPAGPASAASAVDDGAVPEWGVADIHADQVWKEYEDRGEGIVVANIDSGVQYDHPDLVANYRGSRGDGSFTHDYNFYDPTGQCGADGTPCDNNGHGTHTMGTMAGAGGIGVAPKAKWIAAKGCESDQCSDASLLAAGQWILAPTDREGRNPRPDLAPHIVNNSWGGGVSTFYQDIVEAWNAAGIFEAFAAGNDGDGRTCSTTRAPGAQAPSYGVGAYDAAGRIASFSGFGPSPVDGSAKPNISAPGVQVRSAWPGSAYNTINGTSMATPHVAGAVALLWSAAPSLIGNIDATRALLDEGARDVDDTRCGGTPGRNHVWGEGKLDVLASVEKAPHTAATVSGKVTDGATGAGLPHITVTATDDSGTSRTVTTGADGFYRLPLAPGAYAFSFGGYGYATGTAADVTLAESQAFTQDIALTAVASHRVSGTVRDVTGKALAGATVALDGTPLAAVTTNAKGRYVFTAVAEGSYGFTVKPTAPVLCNGVHTGTASVGGADLTEDVRLPNRTDAAGNSCAPAAYQWTAGTKKVALSGDEDAATIALPFPVKHYGVAYSSASVTTNGLVGFLSPRVGDYANTALPAAGPNGVKGVLAPLWDDLTIDRKSSVRTATTGVRGSRTFAVVWDGAAYANGAPGRSSFAVVFDEATGAVTFQYKSVADRGAGATVGIADQSGADALQYAYDQPVIADGSAVRFTQGAK